MSNAAMNKITIPGHTMNPEEIIEAEKKHLNLDKKKAITGLAISGGGIRSASFGLGVMQALVAKDQLSKIDYLSTVSGGGYLGSALTWALYQDKTAGTSPENFPLGKRGAKKDMNDPNEMTLLLQKDNKLLDYIRQHSNYLTPTPKLDIVSFAAVVIRSMAMSLFVYFSFLTIAITSILWLIYGVSDTMLAPVLDKLKNIFPSLNEIGMSKGLTEKLYVNIVVNKKGLMLLVGVVILAIVFIKGFIYSISTFFNNKKVSQLRYKAFISGQKSIGFMLKIGLTCLVFGSLPFIKDWIKDFTALAASGSTLFGSVVGLWQYKKAQQNQKGSSISSDILIYAGAIALFYGVLLLAYLMATNIFLEINEKAHTLDWNIHGGVYAFIILVVLSLLFGILVNLNLIGPHHIWRNRLMEAFMPNKSARDANAWAPATDADAALMEDMCCDHNPKPYHIVNTNVILSNSPKVDYSSRGGDNFIISPLFCGSTATGWRTTKTFHKKKSSGITLATAMATSAAALNPNAGVSGEGVTRNYVISILLSFLNLRLGYWSANPSMKNNIGTPNFFIPGLTSEIFKTGLSESNRYIQLSDGGHFENLAIYELIRRKLDLIVLSDGGADSAFNFDDLANAIEKARVDFGTKISFIPGCGLDNILPGTAGGGDQSNIKDEFVKKGFADDQFNKKYEIARKGFAIADIFYNDGKKGQLVYLKLAMIGDLPTDVYSYKGMNPPFPHESTADQFFSEKQFEAYRELGYAVGWQMLDSAEGKKIFQS